VIVFDHATPMSVDHAFALIARANAISPVIFIGKTAARPAQYWDTNFSQRIQHIVANAMRVGDGRILAHPESLVNASPQMLGKMTVYVRANCAEVRLRIDLNVSLPG
jgi:hypothetical protein